jgi:CO/xanthine dehydrogenase Mo-binding subunit
MGQGARTVFAQIAAEALQVPLEYVLVTSRGDTAADQDSLQTTSSRGTICAGNAILRAAEEAQEVLQEMAAQKMAAPPELVVRDYDEFRRIDSGQVVSLRDVLLYCFQCGRRLIGKGWWCVPEPKIDPATGQGNPFHIFAYGAQVIEVEVNPETGDFAVQRIIAAQDVGKAINPQMVLGQMEGGVVMGLGLAMTEELVVDQGRFVNPGFANFLIPTAADVPEIIPIMVEDPYPHGPFGAKGVGEPGTVATAAALANAIYDAVGVRITQLPITAERIWQALQEKEAKKVKAAGS